MFVHSVLEAPNTKTNSLCVQTHLAIKLLSDSELDSLKCFSLLGLINAAQLNQAGLHGMDVSWNCKKIKKIKQNLFYSH